MCGSVSMTQPFANRISLVPGHRCAKKYQEENATKVKLSVNLKFTMLNDIIRENFHIYGNTENMLLF